MAGSGALTALIFVSLLFSSVSISYFVTEMRINEQIDTIDIPSLPNQGYSSNQDFKNGVFDNTLFLQSDSAWVNNLNIGYHPTSVGSQPFLYIKNLKLDNNEITNTYYINNSALEYYWIVITRIDGTSPFNKVLKFDSTGIHLVEIPFGISLGDKDFKAYPNIERFNPVKIQTKYNSASHTINVLVNDFYSFDFLNIEDSNNILLTPVYYGGVGSYETSFTLEKFTTSGNIATTSNVFDITTWVFTFIDTFIKLTVWTLPESIMPFILNVLLIKSQIAALVISLVFFGRS